MEAQLRRQKGPVTDILVWVQCFVTLVSTLSLQYPGKVPEFMAYLATIVRCQRDYGGPAWVLYDRAFRRRVEAMKDLNCIMSGAELYLRSNEVLITDQFMPGLSQ